MSVLSVKDISIEFGGLKAVTDFNLDLEQSELVGLIGPNGAGKTTIFNMLTGVYRPTKGRILLDEKVDITGMQPHRIAQLGIARTFQNIRLFKDLTVLENVLISRHFNVRYGFLDALLHTNAYASEEGMLKGKSMELLSILKIDNKYDELAKNLPYGEQRKLEIARALATEPKILLLDEPAAGMNPQETRELSNLIHFIKDRFNLTILLIEHDMSLVMNICKRILVLDYGMTIAEGTPGEISKNPAVIKAYLGEEAELDA